MAARTARPGQSVVRRAVSRLPLALALVLAGSAVCVVYNFTHHRGIHYSGARPGEKGKQAATRKAGGARTPARPAQVDKDPLPVAASAVVLVRNKPPADAGAAADAPAEVRVINLYEATRYLSSGEVIFVDARSKQRWEMGHIPGAIDIPSSDFDRGFAAAEPRLPRDATIAVYCESEHCDQAEEVIRRLQEKGYRRLLHFKQGWIYWEFSDQRQEKSGEWAK